MTKNVKQRFSFSLDYLLFQINIFNDLLNKNMNFIYIHILTNFHIFDVLLQCFGQILLKKTKEYMVKTLQ